MSYDPARIIVADLLSALRIDARHDGDRWWASCPSPGHSDSDPSWAIKDLPGDPDHNALHHCFGCEYGGTAVTLVSDLLDITPPSAVDWIKERAMGKALARLRLEIQVAPLRRRFEMPPGVRFGALDTWVTPARRYAILRGITPDQADRWGLGWAVEGPLAGRIVIPCRNLIGTAVGYSARTFVGAPKRYLTPRREENADPAGVLGEHLWPPQLELRRAVVVTEGAINALAAERAAPIGTFVAALSGSSVHLSQLAKIRSFDRAVVLTDPDPAGDRAASYLATALAAHVEVRRVRLPKGEDAQSVGDEELSEWIESGLRS